MVIGAAQARAVVISVQINAGSDDAEEAIGGSVSTGSGDLEINYDGGDAQYVGLFFDSVTVPAGANICSNTYLQFEADESNSEPTSVVIYGEDNDEPNALGTGNSDVTNRTATTSQVAWDNIPAWTAGVDYQSPSVASIVQEIVNIGSWASGDDIVMVVAPGGGSRVAESEDGNGTPPILHIEYHTGAGCGSATTLNLQIDAPGDDTEESGATGGISAASSDLELVHDGGTPQLIGLRFNNLTIPTGAVINNATIRFTTDEADSDPTSTTVFGELNSSPLTFSGGNNVSGRTRTSASVDWDNIPAWTTIGASTADQTTPELAAVVQEIVDLGGWASGNSMAFILEGGGERTAESFDGSPGNAAILEVDYSTLVPGEADIGVAITDSLDPVPVSTGYSYTVTVDNGGPEDAANVQLTFNLPGAVNFVSVFTTQGLCSEASLVVSCSFGTITNGSNAVVTVFVDAPATSQSLNSTATISTTSIDSQTADNSDAESTTVGGNTDQLCYIFSDANNSLSLYDTALGTVTDYASNGTNSIEAIAWDTVNLELYGADGGQFGILSQVDGSWSTVGTGFGVASGTAGSVNLNVINGMAFDAFGGANVMYGVHNRGGNDLLFQIDTSTGTFIAGAFGGNDYVEIAQVGTNGITDDIAVDATTGQMYSAVNNGGSTDRLILVNKVTGATTDIALISIDDAEGLGSDPSGQLWGSSGTGDTVFEIDKFTGIGSNERSLNFGDNEAVDCIGISPTVSADLAVVKTVNEPAPNPGQDIVYTVTLTNNGAADATAIQIQDVLPADVIYVSDAPDQGTYDSGTGFWFVGSLVSGASADLDITVTVNAAMGVTISNTASVSSVSQPDDNSNNNSGSVDVLVSQPVIVVVKTANPTTASPGDTVTFTLTITNTGNAPAALVEVEDDLGVGLDFGFHSYGDGQHFQFTDGGTASGLTMGTPAFDDGSTSYVYPPPAGPAQVFDGNVSDFRLPMTGTMNHSNASFEIEYQTRVD